MDFLPLVKLAFADGQATTSGITVGTTEPTLLLAAGSLLLIILGSYLLRKAER